LLQQFLVFLIWKTLTDRSSDSVKNVRHSVFATTLRDKSLRVSKLDGPRPYVLGLDSFNDGRYHGASDY
jgi:hypothetical protein